MAEINSINDITLDVIIDYCQKNNQVEWLKEVIETPVKPDKKGRERKISFIEIRKEFAIKFMPEFAPNPQKNKPSMYARIAAL